MELVIESMRMNIILMLFLFLVSCVDARLELVQIIFRHGERTPAKLYTNDPYKTYNWRGLSQLTRRGKLEMYKLGVKFRKNYDNFLNSYYSPADVYVLTSYADRCHMSAQLLLAGLFSPKNEQIWCPEIPWQPIPVHDQPRHLDNKIALKRPCASYDAALSEAYKSERIQALNNKTKDLYEYLTLHTGDKIESVRPLETLYNTLEIEKCHNLTLPEWTMQVFPEQMKPLAAQSLAIFTDTEFMKRMYGGVLLKEMVYNMKNKTLRTLNPNRNLFLYSGHDLTIVTILRTLGFDELRKPSFGASLTLELHQNSVDGKYAVKLIYRDNSEEDGEILQWKRDQNSTDLDVFIAGLRPVLPDNWEEECSQVV